MLSRPQDHSATERIMAPSGIEPATFLLVAQCLNCATACPIPQLVWSSIAHFCVLLDAMPSQLNILFSLSYFFKIQFCIMPPTLYYSNVSRIPFLSLACFMPSLSSSLIYRYRNNQCSHCEDLHFAFFSVLPRISPS